MRILPSIEPGDLARALGCAGIGVLGALPLEGLGPDPVALLVWLALCAAPVGALAGGASMHAWIVAPVVPAVWSVALVAVDALSERDLPAPLWAAVAWTGLFAIGFGLGRACAVASRGAAGAVTVAALLLFVCAGLVALPVGGGFLAEPWPPAVAARLVDLSPATLLAECAGLDWMRHPAMYAAAGAADIDPALRGAYRGLLAAPMVLVVGCACVIGGDALARRHRSGRNRSGSA